MKTYLKFSISGIPEEIKINDKIFNMNNFSEYKYIENIQYNKYNFIVLYNIYSDNNCMLNITKLPFYKKSIYGDFLLFSVNNDNILSITEKKIVKLINIICNNIEDYSSDDFSLSD